MNHAAITFAGRYGSLFKLFSAVFVSFLVHQSYAIAVWKV
jgi:hypothetical protein